MKVSYNWLQDYFAKPLPQPRVVEDLLTMHTFEIESVEEKGDDSVFDVKVLPDRSHDCLSHRGIAYEIASLSATPLDPKKAALTPASFPESNVFKLEIEDTEACKRLSAVVMEGVEVKESPVWLQDRLNALGQRSINNIVDATNYVMFSMGQPLHAYDLNLLSREEGSIKLIARKGRRGESLVTLDGGEYELSEDDTVIADGGNGKALGFAGIKGGKSAEISEKTNAIVLEAANFDPVLIRRNAKRLRLRTDASVRFENGISPELTLSALAEAVTLILSLAGGNVQVEGMVDVFPRPAAPYKVGVSLSEINDVLGVKLSREEVESILSRRHFEWMYVDPRDLIVKHMDAYIGVPYVRGASVVHDAPRVFDCSSFTSYLYAQAGVAIPRMSVDQYVFGSPLTMEEALPGDLIFSNTGKGTIHRESIEWMKGTPVPEGVDHVGIYRGDGLVVHTSSLTGGVVEQALSASEPFKTVVGFRRILDNEPRFVITIPSERLDLRIKEDLIEEIGRLYGYTSLPSVPLAEVAPPSIEKDDNCERRIRSFFIKQGFSEVITYVFQSEGEVELQNPLAQDKQFLRKSLEAGLSQALEYNLHNRDLLGLEEVRIFEIGAVFAEDAETRVLGFTFSRTKDQDVFAESLLQELSKELGVSLSLKKVGNVFEVELSSLLVSLPDPSEYMPHPDLSELTFTPFSSFPFVLRDIAVFVPHGEDHEEIIRIIEKESGGLLVNYRLFDTFTKEFPEGKKTSYAYRLAFQSFEKTLTDEEVLPIMEKVTNILNQKAGWQVR